VNKIATRSLWAHKRRLISTCVAIVIGVAFLSGTLILGDTLTANFERLFTDVSARTDVVVRNATVVDPDSVLDYRGPVPSSLVDTVARVPGVATAEAQIVGYGTLLGSDGEPIGGNGPPRQAGSWVNDPDLNPYKLAEGRAPVGTEEVVINKGAAEAGKLHLGDTTTVQTPDPVTVTIVGIATFGDANGLGTATWTAFTLEGAQKHVMHQSDRVSTVLAKAEPGTTSAELRDRIASSLPAGTEAITGRQLADERISDISKQFLGVLKNFLTVFALIALLVAGLNITNAFSITLAQRTRELGLLRAVGASRRQVRRSVAVEALIIGVASSAVGVVGGLGVAGLLKGLFDAFGGALPAGGLDIRVTSVVIGLVTGTAVTLAAALLPTRRAARVAPVEVLRAADLQPLHTSTRRAVIGCAVAFAGVVAGIVSATTGQLGGAEVAAVLVIAGALTVAPNALRPVARALAVPLRIVRGSNARLAADNARRNPRRSAISGTALTVGVTVVALFTVFAASTKTSVDRRINRDFRADVAINTSAFGGAQLSPRIIDEVRAVPEVEHAVALGGGPLRADGESIRVTAADTSGIRDVVSLDVESGSVDALGTSKIAVGATAASNRDWHLGTQLTLSMADGATENVTIAAVYADNQLIGSVLVDDQLWSTHTPQPTERSVLITARPGVSTPDLRAAIAPIASRFGGDLQDRGEFSAAATRGLDTLLGIIYVLLALAILIALLGIANALSLAIHERRYEIGLLRAVGQTRKQTRSVIRLEGIIVATFGTALGLLVGGFLGWTLFNTVSQTAGFTLPIARLVVIAVLGVFAGALAAGRPARRAARLPVLDAIAAP
jgi:putative ABC transport system permease protein